MKFFLMALLVSSTTYSFAATKKNIDETLVDLKSKIKPTAKTSEKIEKPIEVAFNSALPLIEQYKQHYSKQGMERLKEATLKAKFDAVPVLTKVMKDSSFPDKNRWIATSLLGRIMGKKSADYISKFSEHPSWMMRLASLKTLLSLNQTQYKGIYAKALKDPSLIVRYQALENIALMKIDDLAPHVWGMLYDKSNYVGNDGARKRTHIIKEVIKTVGLLKFDKAKKPMLTMIQNEKYKDIFSELDEALTAISPKASPEGNMSQKRHYWSRVALSEASI